MTWVLDARARALGARHRGYGVRAGHYRLAREVMVDSLTAVLGDDFTRRTGRLGEGDEPHHRALDAVELIR